MPFLTLQIALVNLLLCFIIVLLGYVWYKKKKNKVPFYLTLAFGLFGVSHLMSLIPAVNNLDNSIVSVRIIAYLLVIAGMHKAAFREK